MAKKVKREVIRILRNYKGYSLEKLATRPGCLWILDTPSRVGGTLFYPDGRIVKNEVLHGVSAVEK